MRIDIDTRETNNNIKELSDHLFGLIPTDTEEIVIMCIGTDRAIGDSLAPVVGSVLKNSPNYIVYGTIETPIHAMNICEAHELIQIRHPNAFVIAIDAGLSNKSDVGKIIIRENGIRPGLGVGRDLGTVGHVGIMGIMGTPLGNRIETLHQVRLYDMLSVSDTIVRIVRRTINKWRKSHDEFNRTK